MQSKSTSTRRPGGIAGFGKTLSYLLSTRSKYVTDPATVGRVDGESAGKDSDNIDNFDEFDVIIVGGGTAGCVLACRLSEDPSIRVLLLEAGESGRSLLFSRIPAGFPLLFHTKHVYDLYTEPQQFANNKRKYWPRGKMLGGCSSINAQMAQYGSPGDFDEWSRCIKDETWSYKEFSRYFRKFERDISNLKAPAGALTRGSQGPVQIGYFSHTSETSRRFIEASKKIGIPFNPNFNTLTGTNGVNKIMTYIDSKAVRVSSESAYLTDDVLARPNLKVVIKVKVTRVLFGTVQGNTRATGVEFANAQNGPRYKARSRKEIILSAGAIHSPQILIVSGVGSAQHLNELEINVVHDLPGVGKHLVDHPVVDVYFRNKRDTSLKFLKPHSIPDVYRLISAAVKYIVSRRGALADNLGEAAAFIRSDDTILFPPPEYPNQLEDSTSSPDGPDLELITIPLAYKDHGAVFFPMHTYSAHAVLLRPLSVGSITLKSSNAWDDPRIDPQYLQSATDIDKLIRGVKILLKIAQTEPLASYLDGTDKNPDLDHQLHLSSDEEVVELVKERTETLYHPVGTCRMAPLEEDGVVDSQLRVYGIERLRVCDASIFPSIISGHTAGATLATGEKLADILKKQFKLGM